MAKKSKVKLQDIARHAGVSVATVSMALTDNPKVNPETVKSIKELSRKLGYIKSARSLAKDGQEPRSQKRFGYILIGNRLEDEDKMGLARSLATFAAKDNLRFELSAIEEIDDESKLIDQTISYSQGLDGLILSLSRHSDWALLSALGKQKKAIMLIGHLPKYQEQILPKNCGLIAYSCFDMGQTATEYLLSKGHTRIGFISEDMPEGMVHDRWREGYLMALVRRDIALNSSWIHVAGKIFAGGGPAAKAMKELGKQRPTAYVIPDVRTAASFMHEMQKFGVEIMPDSLVMGGELNVTKIHNVQKYPLLTINSNHLAMLCLRRLVEICELGSPCPTITEILFDKYNM